MDEQLRKRQQKKGIALAKEKGKYKGRKRKEIDDKFLEKIISRFQKKEIPLEEALWQPDYQSLHSTGGLKKTNKTLLCNMFIQNLKKV